MVKIITITKEYHPYKLIRNGNIEKISWIKKQFVINKVSVFLEVPKNGNYLTDSKLEKVVIDTDHPNANIESREFCLPQVYLDCNKLDLKRFLKDLEKMLITFNIDSCYWTPLLTVDYGTEDLNDEEMYEFLNKSEERSSMVVVK